MDTLTRRYDECDNFAFLEFVNEGVRDEVAEHFKSLRHGTLTAQGMNPVMICEIVTDVPERFLLILFNGDVLSGYGAFFQWCEQRLHEAALLSVGAIGDHSGVGIYAVCDQLEVEVLQDELSMCGQSEYYQKCEQKLITSFLKEVTLNNYSETSINRIIEMCCLGDDPNDKRSVVRSIFRDWAPPVGCGVSYNALHWADAIQKCHTTGKDYDSETWSEGDSLLVRVLEHLVYAERMNPTPLMVQFKNRYSGVKRLNLK